VRKHNTFSKSNTGKIRGRAPGPTSRAARRAGTMNYAIGVRCIMLWLLTLVSTWMVYTEIGRFLRGSSRTHRHFEQKIDKAGSQSGTRPLSMDC